jgi:hypothetical protein
VQSNKIISHQNTVDTSAQIAVMEWSAKNNGKPQCYRRKKKDNRKLRKIGKITKTIQLIMKW